MSRIPVHSPADLKKLSFAELERLAEDTRQTILSVCLKNGGHLGASLGAVELAIALHRVFDSPREPIVWDVGHQAYAHKLITGRWERFETLRLSGGLSGFLSRAESEHDVLGAGHSSTSISAALAMAWAHGRVPELRSLWSVAVIGDGGLTAGLALEALNNISASAQGPLLLVLNDNQMSISPNVGSIARILAEGKAEEFFGQFGLEYVGPVDGHDLEILVNTLSEIRASRLGRPVLLHVLTQKGKGYGPAEERPAAYHGVSPVRPSETKITGGSESERGQQTFSQAFGEELCRIAQADDRVVAITAAMPEGTGLSEFARRFPDRFFDVGIAEPHAVTFAAGLATQGYRPVVAIYSTFLQRALDGVIHDVALQSLPVTFAIDRAGVVGADGPTHHGAFDLAYLGAIPGLKIASPQSLSDLRALLSQAIVSGGPFAIRYPRGGGAEHSVSVISLTESPQVIAVALGPASSRLARAVERLGDPRVLALSTGFAKPLAPDLLGEIAKHPHAALLTVEDGATRGGFGQALVSQSGAGRKFRVLGYPDHWIPHGAPAELERELGLDENGIAEALQELLSK